jgi:hypothetical protein
LVQHAETLSYPPRTDEVTMMKPRDLAPYFRLAFAFNRYLRFPLDPRAARMAVARRHVGREEALVQMVQASIYDAASSPYRKLLDAAGWTKDAVITLIRQEGVEGALRRLSDSGVYVTLEEFKGKRPAVRGSHTFHFTEADFDNPHLAHHLEVQSGGTRSAGTRVLVKLDFTEALAGDTAILFDEHGLWDHSQAIWLPFGGGASVALLIYAKLGRMPVKWFSHVDGKNINPRFRWAGRFMAMWARLFGAPLPVPQVTPLSAASVVARFMAESARAGRPVCVTTYASSAVRAALAATELGLDLHGCAFITIGEPLTDAKRRTIEASGARVIVRYAMTEAGIIGYGCGRSESSDELHLLSDNLALVQRTARVGGGGELEVEAFLYTSLLPSAPKILFNVESGDHGAVASRPCGCRLEAAGYTTHLSGIRSFEKLTGEGVTFAKSSLIRVLEETLPERFGGRATDYQLVEREEPGGLTRLELVVNPSVGTIDTAAVKETFLKEIGWGGESIKMMSLLWEQANILEVRRAAPISTKMGKVQPFHLERSRPR